MAYKSKYLKMLPRTKTLWGMFIWYLIIIFNYYYTLVRIIVISKNEKLFANIFKNSKNQSPRHPEKKFVFLIRMRIFKSDEVLKHDIVYIPFN